MILACKKIVSNEFGQTENDYRLIISIYFGGYISSYNPTFHHFPSSIASTFHSVLWNSQLNINQFPSTSNFISRCFYNLFAFREVLQTVLSPKTTQIQILVLSQPLVSRIATARPWFLLTQTPSSLEVLAIRCLSPLQTSHLLYSSLFHSTTLPLCSYFPWWLT